MQKCPSDIDDQIYTLNEGDIFALAVLIAMTFEQIVKTFYSFLSSCLDLIICSPKWKSILSIVSWHDSNEGSSQDRAPSIRDWYIRFENCKKNG